MTKPHWIWADPTCGQVKQTDQLMANSAIAICCQAICEWHNGLIKESVSDLITIRTSFSSNSKQMRFIVKVNKRAKQKFNHAAGEWFKILSSWSPSQTGKCLSKKTFKFMYLCTEQGDKEPVETSEWKVDNKSFLLCCLLVKRVLLCCATLMKYYRTFGITSCFEEILPHAFLRSSRLTAHYLSLLLRHATISRIISNCWAQMKNFHWNLRMRK